MRRGSRAWMLEVASASLAVVAVLTSPLFAYTPPQPGETCTQTCDRWEGNGFPECTGGGPAQAQCNRNKRNACYTACANNTCPTAFSCDSGQNSTTGGQTGPTCKPNSQWLPGQGGANPCTVGCWNNGPCAACRCLPDGELGTFQTCSCKQPTPSSPSPG